MTVNIDNCVRDLANVNYNDSNFNLTEFVSKYYEGSALRDMIKMIQWTLDSQQIIGQQNRTHYSWNSSDFEN